MRGESTDVHDCSFIETVFVWESTLHCGELDAAMGRIDYCASSSGSVWESGLHSQSQSDANGEQR